MMTEKPRYFVWRLKTELLHFLAVGLCLVVLFLPGSPSLAADVSNPRELGDLSLEQLADLEITSVSKHEESLSSAPASIYVITRDDIRRSGVTSIPEALRLAPNLMVARVDTGNYAISARGFNGTIANKLLVLIDGRTVYTPLFSGVFWDAQDTLLDDVDRIEVISGPGATLWGANAVNGVINIITKSSADTPGNLADIGMGDREWNVGFRHGGKAGADADYRVYGKYFSRDNTHRHDDSPANDEWDGGQAGFRMDWNSGDDNVMVQGNAYNGDIGDSSAPGRTDLAGVNLLGRWTRQYTPESQLHVQIYYDYTYRDIRDTFAEELQQFDLELQHFFMLNPRNGITWGVGFRHAWDDVINGSPLAFLPASRDLEWWNLFLQDKFDLLPDAVTVTAGIKLDHNTYSGLEYLPSVRMAWKLTDRHTIWAALSRAIRAPARLDRELFIPGNPPYLLAGGPDFEAEISNVIELGYRSQPTQNSSLSITAFYSDLDHLRGISSGPGGSFVITNNIKGHTRGIEAWASYQPLESWRLNAGVLLFDRHLPQGAEGNDPDYQLQLGSTFEISNNWNLYLNLRRVGSLPSPQIPGYTELDTRLGWRPHQGMEFSLSGRNLLHQRHPESGAAPGRSEIDRSVYFQYRWSF